MLLARKSKYIQLLQHNKNLIHTMVCQLKGNPIGYRSKQQARTLNFVCDANCLYSILDNRGSITKLIEYIHEDGISTKITKAWNQLRYMTITT